MAQRVGRFWVAPASFEAKQARLARLSGSENARGESARGKMALQGPQLRSGRVEELADDKLARALRLAREIEELLEDSPSSRSIDLESRSAHSTRIARAMAAGLVDELAMLVRGLGRSGLS